MNHQSAHIKTAIYEFGNFRFDPHKQQLTLAGKPIQLQAKTYELLIAFLESDGRLLSRSELMDQLWADTFVDENNLSQQIRSLRRALTDPSDPSAAIETVPRRGYRFLWPVESVTRGVSGDNGAEPGPPHSVISFPSNSNAAQGPARRFTARKAGIGAALICLTLIGAAAAIYLLRTPDIENVPLSIRDPRGIASHFERSTAKKITDAESGAISPDGKLIAFSQILNDRQSLSVRHIESGTTSVIGNRIDGEYRSVAFSPDSQYVFFMSPKGEGHSYDLNRISVFGGQVSSIQRKVSDGYSISTNGIAFVREDGDTGECRLSVSDHSGQSERMIAGRRRPFCYGLVRWSADARSIIASVPVSEAGVHLYELIEIDLDTGKEKPLTAERWVTIRDFAWMPGQELWLVAGRKDQGSDFNRVWYIDPRSGSAHRISAEPVNFNSLSVASNGRALVAKRVTLNSNLMVVDAKSASGSEKRIVGAYGRLAWPGSGKLYYATANEKALWTINPDGSQPQMIDRPTHVHLTTSADGAFVISAKETNGSLNLWRMNADGSDARQLTFGGGEQRPAITSDNRWVYYESKTGSKLSIWKVPFEGGEPSLVIESGSVPAVSPNGQFLAHFVPPRRRRGHRRSCQPDGAAQIYFARG